MKLVPLFVAFSLGALLMGCAGSGDDSGSAGGGGTPIASADTVIEAIVAPGGTVPADPSNYVYQDNQNIEANQTVQFQLASYDAAGNRTILPVGDWVTSDSTSTYGSIGTNSGLYIAGPIATPSSSNFVQVTYNGKTYAAAYAVKPRQATIVSKVVDSTTGAPVRTTTLQFYDSEGVLVGKVKQPKSGSFRASVPLNADLMVVVSESVPSRYRKQFEFNSLGFQAGDVSCSVKLPVLTVGTNNLDSNILLVPTTSPEPDLTGCGI